MDSQHLLFYKLGKKDGTTRDTLAHKIFNHLNESPDIEHKQILFAFLFETPRAVSQLYYRWLRITYDKYIANIRPE